jgi:hypothetical protein
MKLASIDSLFVASIQKVCVNLNPHIISQHLNTEKIKYARFSIYLDEFQRKLTLSNSTYPVYRAASSWKVRCRGLPRLEIQLQFFQLLGSPDKVDGGRRHGLE